MNPAPFVVGGIWDLSLLTKLVTVVLYFFWATTIKPRNGLIHGLFPGLIGLNIANAATYLTVFQPLVPAAQQTVNLLITVLLQLSCAYYGWFVGRLPRNAVPRRLKWSVWAVISASILMGLLVYAPFLQKSWSVDTPSVVILLNLSLTLVFVLVAAGWNRLPDSDAETAMIKKLLKRIAAGFVVILPVSVIDAFWFGSPHPLGYRFTTGAVISLFINVLCIGYFYGWLQQSLGEKRQKRSGAVPGEDQDPFLSLTKRQTQILDLIAEGNSNKEIGKSVHLSENTIKYHVSTILDKLGMKSREEAARWYKTHSP